MSKTSLNHTKGGLSPLDRTVKERLIAKICITKDPDYNFDFCLGRLNTLNSSSMGFIKKRYILTNARGYLVVLNVPGRPHPPLKIKTQLDFRYHLRKFVKSCQNSSSRNLMSHGGEQCRHMQHGQHPACAFAHSNLPLELRQIVRGTPLYCFVNSSHITAAR